jgi:hypothetical protein
VYLEQLNRWVAVGVGRYVVEKGGVGVEQSYGGGRCAEIAVTIQDRWQGLGLANLIGFATCHAAYNRGITSIKGIFLSQNTPVQKMVEAMKASGVQVSVLGDNDANSGEEDYGGVGVTAIKVALPLGVPLTGLSSLTLEDIKRFVAAASGKSMNVGMNE